jgi:ribokinase
MNPHLVVVGSLNMDLVVQTPRIPKIGETVSGAEDLKLIPGGKGANQAYGSAMLGADVVMIGRVGNDAFGDTLVLNLDNVKVDTRFITRDPDAATGIALIMVEESGQNIIVVSPGANRRVSPEDVSQGESVIRSADVLLLQLEIPLETVTRAVEIARLYDVITVLNPAPAQHLPGKLLSSIDYIIPNETEMALLSEYEINTDNEIRQAASALRELGANTIVMTIGSRGAVLITEKEFTHFPTFPIDPVDTTAAGDAFVASFAVALAEGKSLQEAVRFGNAAGALACTKLGAQPSLPDRDHLENLIRTSKAQ